MARVTMITCDICGAELEDNRAISGMGVILSVDMSENGLLPPLFLDDCDEYKGMLLHKIDRVSDICPACMLRLKDALVYMTSSMRYKKL